jgi:uncharacterized small protein (DUF1192 family)
VDALKAELSEKQAALAGVDDLNHQVAALTAELERNSREMEELKKPAAAAAVTEKSSKESETKMLKMKAQMTSKIKSLEKQLEQLRKVIISDLSTSCPSSKNH